MTSNIWTGVSHTRNWTSAVQNYSFERNIREISEISCFTDRISAVSCSCLVAISFCKFSILKFVSWVTQSIFVLSSFMRPWYSPLLWALCVPN